MSSINARRSTPLSNLKAYIWIC